MCLAEAALKELSFCSLNEVVMEEEKETPAKDASEEGAMDEN